MVIRYEDIKSHTVEKFKRILSFIEIDIPDSRIKKIIENSTLDNMRALEASNKLHVGWLKKTTNDPRASKVRTGGSDSLKDYFSEDDLEFMHSVYRTSETFRILGYL